MKPKTLKPAETAPSFTKPQQQVLDWLREGPGWYRPREIELQGYGASTIGRILNELARKGVVHVRKRDRYNGTACKEYYAPTAADSKAELTPESDARAKLRAMIDAAEHFNSDEAYVIARDDRENVISVGVVTVGETAVALAKWLERRKKA